MDIYKLKHIKYAKNGKKYQITLIIYLFNFKIFILMLFYTLFFLFFNNKLLFRTNQ